MPCSCGNTNCPCGIPCCCSEESCKCQTCEIALPRCCKICNKPLISEIQSDEDKCSCFIRESTALIFENWNNPQYRIGSKPMPVGYFVSGKLMVNVMIPVPVLKFPQFIHPQSIRWIPALPSIPINSGKVLPSLLLDGNSANPLCPKENFDSFSIAESHQSLIKSNEQSSVHPSTSNCSKGEINGKIFREKTCPSSGFPQSKEENQSVNTVQNAEPKTKEHENEILTVESHLSSGKSSKQSNHPSSSICSNGEQNTKISIENTCTPTRFLQSTEKNQKVNEVQNIMLETEECSNKPESYFYLPSITIGNISHHVGLADSTWRLSNPAFSFEGTSDSSLKLYNPFYFTEKYTTETKATYEKDCRLSGFNLHSKSNIMQNSTKIDKNVQTDGTLTLQMNGHPSDPTKILEQSDVAIKGEYAELENSSNIVLENECISLPSTINSNTNALPRKSLNPKASTFEVQTQPINIDLTSVSLRDDRVADLSPQKRCCPFYLENFYPDNLPQIIPEHSGAAGFSSNLQLQRQCSQSNNANSEENNQPIDHESFVLEMNQRNKEHSELNDSIPLYIDVCTTKNMDRLLKSAEE